jgi:hypothetical protein
MTSAGTSSGWRIFTNQPVQVYTSPNGAKVTSRRRAIDAHRQMVMYRFGLRARADAPDLRCV